MKELLVIGVCLALSIVLDPLVTKLHNYLEARRSRRK
jgi:hypothetical protein